MARASSALIGVLALTLFAGAADAQAPTVTKQFGDFVVRCLQTKSAAPCDLFEERGNKDTGQRVLSLSLGYMPSQSRYIMQIAVPLGVAIESGVVVTSGKFTSPAFPLRRCDETGCYVEIAVPRDLIDDFAKSGPDAKIKVVADGGKSYSFSFSFDGFAAAHDDMVAENKAKASNPEGADTLSTPPAKPPAKR